MYMSLYNVDGLTAQNRYSIESEETVIYMAIKQL